MIIKLVVVIVGMTEKRYGKRHHKVWYMRS